MIVLIYYINQKYKHLKRNIYVYYYGNNWIVRKDTYLGFHNINKISNVCSFHQHNNIMSTYNNISMSIILLSSHKIYVTSKVS